MMNPQNREVVLEGVSYENLPVEDGCYFRPALIERNGAIFRLQVLCGDARYEGSVVGHGSIDLHVGVIYNPSRPIHNSDTGEG